MARQKQKRRPTAAEKELQDRCETLERRLQSVVEMRQEETKQRQEVNAKQVARIETLERELSDERREHRTYRYASQEEIDKLKRWKDELQTALNNLRVRHEQLGNAFKGAVKALCD